MWTISRTSLQRLISYILAAAFASPNQAAPDSIESPGEAATRIGRGSELSQVLMDCPISSAAARTKMRSVEEWEAPRSVITKCTMQNADGIVQFENSLKHCWMAVVFVAALAPAVKSTIGSVPDDSEWLPK